MKLGFTIHAITVGKERYQLPINSVQEFGEDEFDRLLSLGAIREPNEREQAIYETLHGLAADAADVAPAKPAKATKAAKTAAAVDAAPTVDPDEVEGL